MQRICFVFALLVSTSLQAKDYFVSNAGSDNGTGSFDQPFRTLKRLRSVNTQPGDRFLLDGQSKFFETLILNKKDSGNTGFPVVITSYGIGQPKIVAVNRNGVLATDTSSVILDHIAILGDGSTTPANGVHFLSTENQPVTNVVIRNVYVSGFKSQNESTGIHPSVNGNGILVATYGNGTGFQNVLIENIEAANNEFSGISVRSRSDHYNSNIHVLNSHARDNVGIRGSIHHTGNGIVVSQSRDVLIEGNHAYRNGKNNEANGGPVGIWAWQATDIIIRKNFSYENRTASGSDGGGFDFDGGVSNGLMEENVSWSNDGAGYLLCTYPGSGPVENIIVRNNVSKGDGMRNNYGAITISGHIKNSVFEDNQIEVFPHSNSTPPAVLALFYDGNGVAIRGNQIVLKNGTELLRNRGGRAPTFEDNDITNPSNLAAQ